MRWTVALGVVALVSSACGSEQAVPSTPAPVASTSTAPTTDSEVIPAPPTASASTTSRPDEPEQTSLPTTTVLPTTVAANVAGGASLAAMLAPYEARALADTVFTSYRFSCWPYTGPGSVWPDWQLDEVDRDQPVSRGTVLSCLPRTDPPADVGDMDLIVLDDDGTITWWWVGSDAIGHVPAAPGGLLCREYMATEEFQHALEWMGATPPWSDDVLAYQWVLAYWFLEGQPERMDVDGNGRPCELLFDQEVVADVLAGDRR
jgi:hypothetical protein